MSVLSDRGYGKIYNGKLNALLHNESRTDFRLCGSGWCRTQIKHKNYFNPPIISTGPLYYAVQINEKAEHNGNEPNSVADYDIILNNPEGAVQPEIIDNI